MRELQASALRYVLKGGILAPCGQELKLALADARLARIFGVPAAAPAAPAAPAAGGAPARALVRAWIIVSTSLTSLLQASDFVFRRPMSEAHNLSVVETSELLQAYHLNYNVDWAKLQSGSVQRFKQIDIVGRDSTLSVNELDFLEVPGFAIGLTECSGRVVGWQHRVCTVGQRGSASWQR